MADAIPPAPPTVPLPSTGGSGPVAVTVTSDAAAVVKLLDGALLEGAAAARASKGAVELVTADGVLQLKVLAPATLPAFPAGARLTLQMVGNGQSGQLFLVAINGRPLAGMPPGGLTPGLPGLPGQMMPPLALGAAASRPVGLPASPGLPGNGGPNVQPPALGAIGTPAAGTTMPLGLSATIIRPALSPGTTPPPMPGQSGAPGAFGPLPLDLPPGTQLTVRIAGVLPPDIDGPGIPSPPLSTPAGTPTPAGAGGPGQPSPPPAAGMAAPAQNATPAGSGPVLLPGSVSAHPPGGHAVVQTPIGTLAVPTHADLPEGTRLTLEVVGRPQLPPAATATTLPPRPEGLTAQGWPVLSQALDVLATANQPQALEQLLRVVPQADARLAASMAAFAGALRTGDAKALLPDTAVRALEKSGKKEMVSRLRADLEALTEDAGRPVGNGDWRTYTLPFLNGGMVEPVRLYVRKAGDEEAGAKARGAKGNDHRFVVDLNLTRLGRLQLDGLVRREDKLFDLIIRTGEALSADMRRDILGIFTDASELVGTKGTVSFQAGGRWMDFPPAPPAPTRLEV